MPRLTSSLLALLVIGATGCVDLPAESSAEQANIICPKWECGSNSPVVNGLGFHDLNLAGLMNNEGFSVIGMTKGSNSYQLDVDRGRIRGLSSSGAVMIAGAALQDAQIRIRHGAKIFAIRITGVSTINSFAKIAGSPRPIETYLLDVAEIINGAPPTGWRNLCSNPPPYHSPDLLGINQFHTAVFEGERIDATA